jgi:HK97 family phage prohead protease
MKPKVEKGSIERRSFAGELRAADATKFEISGYAASFGVLSRDLGGFKERLAPGCFKRSLAAGDDVKALFNHDANVILGRRENGTLEVSEDERGLKFRVRLNPASQQHRDIYASVQRGDISQCSFAFTVRDDAEDWEDAEDEQGKRFIRRTIRECNLMDVSAVTYPAYSENNATSVQARSAAVDYRPSQAHAAWLAEAKRKADAIYKEMVRTATGFREIAPNHFVPCEWDEEARIDRMNRHKADEIGRRIFADQVREDWIN